MHVYRIENGTWMWKIAPRGGDVQYSEGALATRQAAAEALADRLGIW